MNDYIMVPKMEKCKQEWEENLKLSLLCIEQQFFLWIVDILMKNIQFTQLYFSNHW